MKADYADIKLRIPLRPAWYDENGTPRYSDFRPDDVANIYSEYVVLLEIQCGTCRERFAAAVSVMRFWQGGPDFDERCQKWLARDKNAPFPFCYGDPPRHACSGAGETMPSETLRVLEFWQNGHDWRRHSEYERVVDE